jgi:predicted nucleic acid-binding protein
LAATIRSELEAPAEVVEPAAIEPVTRNAADDLVLAAAVTGDVDVVVTRDKELLALESYESIGIVSPRSFVDRHDDST